MSRAIAQAPDHPDCHNILGLALQGLGRLEDAAGSYAKALELNPGFAEAHINLGNAMQDLGRLEDAVAGYRKAITLNPDFTEAHNNLGNALKALGRLDEARASLEEAIVLNPELAVAHSNLGSTLRDLGRLDEARASLEEAIALNPELAEAHNNLGTTLKEIGRLDDAADSIQRALSLNPGLPEAHNSLGGIRTDLGEFNEAIDCYKKALAIRPDHPDAANNYLHTLLYLPDLTNEELFDRCRQTAAHRPSSAAGPGRDQAPPPAPGASPLAPDERQRIGYLSSDFHDHPLGDIVMPLLGNHDHRQVEIFCYADVIKPDHVTGQFRGHADHWRTINGLTDAEIAAQIRDDGIHVMVYLGGHFDNNHPSVAILRPAPVQVSMHGGTTSALDEMDFWLTDSVLHPPGDTGERFTEDLVRLPAFYIYPKTEGAPPVSKLPAEDNGFITFASFNKPCKTNGTVLDLWSEILLAVPDARLMLKFRKYLSVPSISRKLLDRLESNGVPPERITLVSTDDSFHDHLAHYTQADIALDPFPFNGATTTFQSLWMGVPVISLLGKRFISRAGGSISTHAGLQELVAETPQDYVDKAVALAGDLPRLKDLRATLRQRVGSSSLCDGPGYAANVEKAFLSMWESRMPGG